MKALTLACLLFMGCVSSDGALFLSARPRIVREDIIVNHLSMACWASVKYDLQATARIVLTYHWRYPNFIYLAAEEVDAHEGNLKAMREDGCNNLRSWAPYFSVYTSDGLDKSTQLLAEAEPWIRAMIPPEGTP